MTQAAKEKAMMKKKKIQIVVVDDHPILRQGLAQMINLEKDLAVCGEAESAHQAIEIIAAAKPDIAIVDITLKDSNGVELIKDIRTRHPDLPILVLSMHDESLYAERVLRAGAKGYIMKREPPQKLLHAIHRILDGHIYVSEAISERMLTVLSDGKTVANRSPIEHLSDRELEIFQCIGNGLGRQKIAEKLNISVKTVEAHRAKIIQKLKLKDSSDLLQHAIQLNAGRKDF